MRTPPFRCRASDLLCGLILALLGADASATTLAQSEVVRVRGGPVPDTGYGGRIGTRGTCTVVLLDQKLLSGQGIVMLSRVGAMERQDGASWQEVPMKTQRATEPPECADSAPE